MTADPTPDPLQSEYLKREDAQPHLFVLETLREWDPIGVISPSNIDEYDSYAPELIRMLDASASAGFVEEWLLSVARDHMGLSEVDVQQTRAAADKLTAYWKSQ